MTEIQRMGKVLRRVQTIGWSLLEDEMWEAGDFDRFVTGLHAFCETFSPSIKQADIDRAFDEAGGGES